MFLPNSSYFTCCKSFQASSGKSTSGGPSSKEPTHQCKRHKRCRFEKSPWRQAGQLTPVYYCLENPMDRRAWQAIVHGVAKSQTRLK